MLPLPYKHSFLFLPVAGKSLHCFLIVRAQMLFFVQLQALTY